MTSLLQHRALPHTLPVYIRTMAFLAPRLISSFCYFHSPQERRAIVRFSIHLRVTWLRYSPVIPLAPVICRLTWPSAALNRTED